MKKETAEKRTPPGRKRGAGFTAALLHWNRTGNDRQMPWKGEKDPYKIWLSEIMLQQTRVEQGLKYYQKFIDAFPTVQSLAAAPDAKVFKLWEGLGYYSRCRNLLAAARSISNERGGMFPTTYNEILALKGVGGYTAAAIGSFAFNLPHAVLDGNVFRVLSRIFDIDTPIDSTQGKKTFTALAQSMLPEKDAGEYNQAIMDFGAVVCKPAPLCDDCFYNHHCLAYRAGRQSLLPVKEKKTVLKKRWLHYFIVQCGNEVLVQQRHQKDIWQSLHQFVLIETEKAIKTTALEALFQNQYGMENYTVVDTWKEKQVLSHQEICFQFWQLKTSRKKKVENYNWTKIAVLKELAFPRTLQKLVQQMSGEG